MAEHTPTNRPYVRYGIKADVDDKGIGFTIERAAKAYLNSQGFSATIQQVECTGGKYEAVVTVYDNGKMDFNISALREHIISSGRMPGIDKKRPVVNVFPIPCDKTITIEKADRGDEAWIKTTRDLNERLGASEKGRSELARSVGLLQGDIDGKTAVIAGLNRHIGDLEQILDGAAPKQYEAASDAVLYSYLYGRAEQILEGLLEVEEDITYLNDNKGLLDFFVQYSKPSGDEFKDKLKYTCAFTGSSFNSQSELEDFVNSVKDFSSWVETPRAQEITLVYKQILNDEKVLDDTKLGISEEMLNVMRANIQSRREAYARLFESIETEKNDFAAKKAVSEKISEAEKHYERLRQISERVSQRVNNNFELPILFNYIDGGRNISISIPATDSQSKSAEHIKGVLAMFSSDIKDLFDDKNWVLNLQLPQSEKLKAAAGQCIPLIRKFYEPLGVKVKVIELKE